MKLPTQLKERLDNCAFQGPVITCVDQYMGWYETSSLPFFPEYTDHGPNHIENVVGTCERLMTDDAWQVFSANDAAILILAVVLHDAAMHLTEDSFRALVKNEECQPLLPKFDSETWHELWQSFLFEARHFDGPTLRALFDDVTPIAEPNLDPDHMTRRDRKLIGEFLRRHHTRLAHEFAVHGVPGPNAARLTLTGIESDLANLAGLVARSHGMTLRKAMGYLEGSFGNARIYNDVHAVYLMALLRISDYLQIQPQRAPIVKSQFMTLRSQLSSTEWDLHRAIKNVHFEDSDPEAVIVDARPENVEVYLRFKRWLDECQEELDASWAALGEVYGRHPALNSLGLTVRRVRSNIDDDASFRETIPYIPRLAAFDTARGDLLKLLIGPLYGANPFIGIRELVQNAVDAVRERRDLEGQANYRSGEQCPEDCDVLVALDRDDKGVYWLRVQDHGIGMIEDTIVDYFLVAGASYRSNTAWRSDHGDEEGHPRVLRSGRFGIGVLAAFLLGEEIRVCTRHMDAEEGIAFSARLDSSFVELQRTVDCNVGTSVEIRLSDLTYKQVSTSAHAWDWYSLEVPSVKRASSITGESFSQKFHLPQSNQPLPPGWNRIECVGFDDIQWTYIEANRLSCNGLTVLGEAGTRRASSPIGTTDIELNRYCSLPIPNISVFDRKALLPLRLQRDGLDTSSYPFQSELSESVLRDFLAFIILYAPTGPGCSFDFDTGLFQDSTWGYPKQVNQWFKSQGVSLSTCLQTSSGVLFDDDWSLREAGLTTITYHDRRSGSFLPVASDSIAWSHLHRMGNAPCRTEYALLLAKQRFGELLRGTRILCSIASDNRESPRNVAGLPEWKCEWAQGPWAVFSSGGLPPLDLDGLKEIVDTLGTAPLYPPEPGMNQSRGIDVVVLQVHFDHSSEDDALSPIAQAWSKYIGSPQIPLVPEERLKLMPHAFDGLAEEIQKWKTLGSDSSLFRNE